MATARLLGRSTAGTGPVEELTASGGRSLLGATTVGDNLFTLTNPGAITFPRVNADNTVSTLAAAAFRSAIGAGTSSTAGTVTSVGGTGTINGITLTGTVTASGNLVLGGTLSGVSLTAQVSGILPVANGGTNNAFFTVSGPATSAKTYTLPNVSSVILTDNTPVTVAQGGTGRGTSTTAYGLLAAGTTATGVQQTLAVGLTTQMLVGGGASALPAWVVATGTGAPVRGTAPTITDVALSNTDLGGIKNATFNSQTVIATTTGAITLNWTTAQNQLQTEPTGTITYTFTAPAGPCHLQLIINSDGTSSAQTINWPGTVIQYGATFAMTANKRSVVNFWYDGTNYHMTSMAQV
jgi:hypothetical protein